MKTTIYVLEYFCTEYKHGRWQPLSAYDTLDDAVEHMEHLKREDNKYGEADDYLYGIKEVVHYHTDD